MDGVRRDVDTIISLPFLMGKKEVVIFNEMKYFRGMQCSLNHLSQGLGTSRFPLGSGGDHKDVAKV